MKDAKNIGKKPLAIVTFTRRRGIRIEKVQKIRELIKKSGCEVLESKVCNDRVLLPLLLIIGETNKGNFPILS